MITEAVLHALVVSNNFVHYKIHLLTFNYAAGITYTDSALVILKMCKMISKLDD